MGTKRRTPADARIAEPPQGRPGPRHRGKKELENESSISRGSAEKILGPRFAEERGARKRVQWPNWPPARGPGPNKGGGTTYGHETVCMCCRGRSPVPAGCLCEGWQHGYAVARPMETGRHVTAAA